MDNVFLQMTALLAITVGVSFIIRLLRQPLIVAYIISGIACGPLFLDILHGQKEMYTVFGQFGVVLLLFIIGLNLNVHHLKHIGKTSVLAGLAQFIFTAGIGVLLLLSLKLSLITAVFLAVAITFSSTIIIMRLLTDKKDTETIYGRHTVGLLLVQDIIAILIMIFLGVLKTGGSGQLTYSIIILFVKGVFAVLAVIVLSKYLLPTILEKVSGSSELLFIFTIAWCFGLSSLLFLLGFSIEIGAIAAGLSLSTSPYQPQIISRLKPLRDFFLVLFFIVLGSTMSVSSFGLIWLPGVILSLFILIGNPLILYFVFRGLSFTRRSSFLIGLAAAQVSEFGFIILFTGQQTGYVFGDEVAIFTFVALVTIFFSSYLIIYNEKIYQWLLPWFRLFGPDKYLDKHHKHMPLYDVWIIGYHRIGYSICEALNAMKAKFIVVDFDPTAIKKLHNKKIPALFGDIADVEFLEDLKFKNTKLVVMTIPAADDQVNMIKHLLHIKSGAIIIANAYHRTDASLLYRAGADYVLMPYILGGDWAAGVLKGHKWTKKRFAELKEEQKKILALK